MDTNQIEISECTTGGILLQRENHAVIIRRNANHPEQMTTLRFLRSEGTKLYESESSPVAFPFSEYDTQDRADRFGWGANVYLWLTFGTESMQSIPEPDWAEIRRFSTFIAACVDEHA